MYNLTHTFGELARTIPTALDDDFLFSPQTLPASPLTIEADQLVIQKGYHDYQEYLRADLLCFHADKPTYRQLGVLLLTCVFHAEPSVITLYLTHPASDIKQMIIESPYQTGEPLPGGYRTHPNLFCYTPSELHNHPWYHPCSLFQGRPSEVSDLPCFFLTNTEDFVVSDEDWKRRDVLRGGGTDRATVLLAELLLNISRPENVLDECTLEGEAGFRGVGPMSAEVRLLLPGSHLWDKHVFV